MERWVRYLSSDFFAFLLCLLLRGVFVTLGGGVRENNVFTVVCLSVVCSKGVGVPMWPLWICLCFITINQISVYFPIGIYITFRSIYITVDCEGDRTPGGCGGFPAVLTVGIRWRNGLPDQCSALDKRRHGSASLFLGNKRTPQRRYAHSPQRCC